MNVGERQIGEGEGERNKGKKEGKNAIPDYMCLCCSVGGHVLEGVRESVKAREKESESGAERQWR